MRTFIFALSLLIPTLAAARPGGKGLGLGVALGDPTGINLKKTLGSNTAFDSTLGLDFIGDDGFSIHACVLWDLRLAGGDPGQLNGYLGIGGKLGFADYDGHHFHDHDHDDDFDDDDELWVGGRAPAGLA